MKSEVERKLLDPPFWGVLGIVAVGVLLGSLFGETPLERDLYGVRFMIIFILYKVLQYDYYGPVSKG